jgi:two-component SAPR family response regulator
MNRFKILVLEDDPQMRSILQQVLEEQDYDVVAVDRGEKAIDAARDHSFDLIIADIRMEGVGGLEAIAQTKAVQPSIGTLIVSGYADPDETERAKQLQIGGYLKKPFKMADFLLYVRTQLSERARSLEAEGTSSQEQDPGTDSVALILECLAALDQPKTRVPAGSFKRITELSDTLGKQVGIVSSVRREIAAACGFILCVGADIDVESWFGPPEQLAAFRSVLAFYEESYESDPQPPLEARLAALVLTAVRCESDAASLWSLPNLAKHKATVAELSTETPHVDPELIDVYLKSLKGDLPATAASLSPRERDQRERTLFMLARTLERAGDRKEATKAYQTIIERHAGTRESLESRLAIARSDPDGKHSKSLREACREASRLGPVTAALTALEAGHLLFKNRDPEAKEFLVGAARSLEKLGLEGALARAAIPLVSLGIKFPESRFPRLIRALSSPEEQQEMRENAPWLLPILFGSLPNPTSEELYALLGQLVDRFGASITSGFQDGKFDESSSVHLAEAIRVGCRQLPEDLVKGLLSDDRPAVAAKAAALRDRLGDIQDKGHVIRIRSFGVLEVAVGEDEVSGNMWKTQKAKFFFAFLAARWGRAVPEETVRDLFWPKNAEKGRKNVYWATSIVRRCLRGDGESNSDIEVLERQGETLRLHPETPRWHDLEEFVRLLAKAQKLEKDGKADAARPLYRRLTRLYRGPYLEGCYMDWAVRYRESLERQVVDALVRLAVLALEAKEYKESVEAAEQALSLDPCRQDAAAIGMKSLAESSQPEKAVEMFQRVEKSLRVDFALEPNTELIELLYRARLGAPGSSSGLIG